MRGSCAHFVHYEILQKARSEGTVADPQEQLERFLGQAPSQAARAPAQSPRSTTHHPTARTANFNGSLQFQQVGLAHKHLLGGETQLPDLLHGRERERHPATCQAQPNAERAATARPTRDTALKPCRIPQHQNLPAP